MKFFSGVIAFTDGASRGNPGPGGWGAVILFSKTKGEGERDNYQKAAVSPRRRTNAADYQSVELGGWKKHTTNNRMELTAAIKALSYISRNLRSSVAYRQPTQIYSDSSYLVNGAARWIHDWRKNGWRTARGKKEVENRDLWERLFKLRAELQAVEWKYVSGHIGVAGNERANEIAARFSELGGEKHRFGFGVGEKFDLYKGSLAEYPVKNILCFSGSVSKKREKETNRSRQRAKAYSYVSLVDGELQIYKTWADCEARVKGKKGARYKKVLSEEEEKETISSWTL